MIDRESLEYDRIHEFSDTALVSMSMTISLEKARRLYKEFLTKGYEEGIALTRSCEYIFDVSEIVVGHRSKIWACKFIYKYINAARSLMEAKEIVDAIYNL